MPVTSWSVLSVTLGVWMGGGGPVHPWSDCLLCSTKKLLKVVALSRSELAVTTIFFFLFFFSFILFLSFFSLLPLLRAFCSHIFFSSVSPFLGYLDFIRFLVIGHVQSARFANSNKHNQPTNQLIVFPSHSKSGTPRCTEVLRRDITFYKLRRLNATPCSSTVSSLTRYLCT